MGGHHHARSCIIRCRNSGWCSRHRRCAKPNAKSWDCWYEPHSVPDLDKAVEFYTKTMGFPEAFQLKNASGQVQLVYVQISQNTFVELQPANAQRPPGITHFGLHVENMAAATAMFRQRRAPPSVRPPSAVPRPSCPISSTRTAHGAGRASRRVASQAGDGALAITSMEQLEGWACSTDELPNRRSNNVVVLLEPKGLCGQHPGQHRGRGADRIGFGPNRRRVPKFSWIHGLDLMAVVHSTNLSRAVCHPSSVIRRIRFPMASAGSRPFGWPIFPIRT